MKVERKIIFETKVGSHLYGTNRPDSDDDFMGIFLPSTDEFLGLQNPPTEWSADKKMSTGERNTKGDINRKYYSLRSYLNLLTEGQSLQLEMLFAPKEMWQFPRRAFMGGWSEILKRREMFVSKGSILPFIGFAKAQAYKAVIKGENLNHLRDMILHLKTKHPHSTIQDAMHDGAVVRLQYTGASTPVNYVDTEGGQKAIVVAGRQFEFAQQCRYALQKMNKMEKKYGTRSEAAAQDGYDFKSLMHAYRLLFEAKMLLTEGKLIFPLPKETTDFLKPIRAGEYHADYFAEIEDRLTELRELKEKSPLPYSVDHAKVNELCQEMLYNHLFGSENERKSN